MEWLRARASQRCVWLPHYKEGHVPKTSCACGCGTLIEAFRERNLPQTYLREHAGRGARGVLKVNWVERAAQWNANASKCLCGCGEYLTRTSEQLRAHIPDPSYLPGHHARRACVEALTSREESIIFGTLLGDMSITRPTATPRLAFTHGPDQLEYARHKVEVLGRLGWWFDPSHKSDGWGSTSVRGSSACMPILESIWQVVRPRDRKEVTHAWVGKLDEVALAYWYMDDGSTSRNSEGVVTHAAIHTEGYSREENDLLRDGVEVRFGVRARVSVSRGYPYLYFPRGEAMKLLQIVTPLLHPSMAYKGIT